MSERRIPGGVKDENGIYTRIKAAEEVKPTVSIEAQVAPLGLGSSGGPSDVSLDSILNRQLLALERVTKQLVIASSSGSMTKDEIQSLATCIKITLDLKAKEKELIDGMSDEELQRLQE